jgi:mono/diheme cytochrome c family protein
MTRSFWLGSILLFALAAFSRSVNAGPVDGRVVDIWVRGHDARGSAAPPRGRSRRLDLDRLPLVTVERYDAQYERVGRYRGASLSEILRDFSPDEGLDLAVLHFSNGMAVPIAFRDRAVMARLDPFIARAFLPPTKGRLATKPFPPIESSLVNRRSIAFSGNKIVVSDSWHPEVATATGFSPWARVDTLVSVELVASRPYYGQFDVGGDPALRRGLALYRESCQFCHGARHVGASFGWDFVDSPPLYDSQSSAANLYHHVAYKPRNATDLGLLMPALGFMTEEEAGDLQRWLRAIATRPMPPYEPPGRPHPGPRRGS